MLGKSAALVFVVLLFAACAGGGKEAPAASNQAPTPAASASRAAAAPAEPARASAAPRHEPLTAESAKQVVRDLIEAFRAGDRAAVEALWARDGGTWSDQAGFEARAEGYRRAEFELAPESMETADRSSAILVVVRARQDGADWLWSFLVAEIGGSLRAGGVESRPAGVP